MPASAHDALNDAETPKRRTSRRKLLELVHENRQSPAAPTTAEAFKGMQVRRGLEAQKKAGTLTSAAFKDVKGAGAAPAGVLDDEDDEDDLHSDLSDEEPTASPRATTATRTRLRTVSACSRSSSPAGARNSGPTPAGTNWGFTSTSSCQPGWMARPARSGSPRRRPRRATGNNFAKTRLSHTAQQHISVACHFARRNFHAVWLG